MKKMDHEEALHYIRMMYEELKSFQQNVDHALIDLNQMKKDIAILEPKLKLALEYALNNLYETRK